MNEKYLIEALDNAYKFGVINVEDPDVITVPFGTTLTITYNDPNGPTERDISIDDIKKAGVMGEIWAVRYRSSDDGKQEIYSESLTVIFENDDGAFLIHHSYGASPESGQYEDDDYLIWFPFK